MAATGTNKRAHELVNALGSLVFAGICGIIAGYGVSSFTVKNIVPVLVKEGVRKWYCDR
jgi:hypothetical protein